MITTPAAPILAEARSASFSILRPIRRRFSTDQGSMVISLCQGSEFGAAFLRILDKFESGLDHLHLRGQRATLQNVPVERRAQKAPDVVHVALRLDEPLVGFPVLD